ncbi:Alpha/Beta hydrolase protein [Sporodiniella umbellata]|nr:Alpha/Beta hydrolase protein [Sporodiniella umbellata]
MGNSSRPKWTILKKSNQTWDDIVSNVEDHFVESLESWRKKVGLDKMTLFGHSLGGYFSACYALKYPERVEKLILVSPAGIPNPPPETITKPNNPQETLQKEAEEISTNFQEGEKPVDPPRRKIPAWATYLWNKNITPMSIVRMTGPFGPRLVHSYTSRRFAHLSESEQHDFYDYL